MMHSKPIKALALALLLAVATSLAACSSRQERAAKYAKEGSQYLTKKEYQKARIEFRNAIQLNQNMLDAWRGLLKVDKHGHDLPGVAQDLRRIVELDDKDAASRVELGTILLASGSPDQALKLANAAGSLDPKNANVLALKSAVLFKLNDKKGAIEEAKKAVALDPHNTEANAVLAIQQISDKDLNGALRTLANISGDHEFDPPIALLKVRIYEGLKDNNSLEALLKRMVSARPNSAAYRTLLLRFYLANHRAGDAEAELRALVKEKPTDTAREFELINFLGATKGLDAARSELDKKISEGGDIVSFQIALANLDFRQGDFKHGTAILQKIIDASRSTDSVNKARIALARMHLGRKEVKQAEPLIASVLDSDSRNTEALLLRASIRIQRNQIDDAITDLRRALNDQPRSPELLATLATAYERSGSIALAAKAYLDAAKDSGFAANFGLTYLSFLERRGYLAQAQSLLDELARRHPTNLTILSALARNMLARHDWAGAHKVAEAMRRISKKKTLADTVDAAAFTGEKKTNEGLSALKDAYQASEGAVQPMASLVEGYIRSGRIESAESFLNSILEANPKNSDALILLGATALAKNDVASAEQRFKQARKLQPDNAAAYRALANLYISQNKLDEALATIKDGLNHQPKDFSLRLTLAGLLDRKQDFDGEIAEYEKMLKDEPGSLIVANNLASVLADNKTDKASRERAQALARLLKGSTVPQFEDTYGWVSYLSGNLTGAMASLRSAAKSLPRSADIQYHLGVVYLAAKERDKGIEILKKARGFARANSALRARIDSAISEAQASKS